jgi:parallel beta-helix repeat protein
MRRTGWFLLMATVAALVFMSSAEYAVANHLSCGATITQDTKLDADLIDCPGDGIAIGAPNITLDLNGHTVDGTHGQQLGVPGGTGIDNSAGHDGVQLKGPGTVRDFVYGVMLLNASDNVVNVLEASANLYGIYLDGDTATGNVFVRNVLVDNVFAGITVTDAYALNVAAGYNSVRRNTAFKNGYGILLGGYGDGNVISHNTLYENDKGILLSDSFGRTLVSKNDVFRNSLTGIDSIELQNSRIEKNQVLGNDGVGIKIDDRNNLIEGNDANRNAGDGIFVSAENTVRRNTANRNGDLGIYAEEGVIDGGGNKAFGNGNPLQCLNVACK